jgi:hypothetical protein
MDEWAGNVDTGTWLVWDELTGELAELKNECMVRKGVKIYQIGQSQWQKMVSEGDHAFFNCRVAYKYWRANFSTICVVEWPPTQPHTLPIHTWCVRFAVSLTDSTTRLSGGREILWPLSFDLAQSLYVQWEQEEEASQSSLMVFPPMALPPALSWTAHPLAKRTCVVGNFWTRIFLAGIDLCSHYNMYKSPAEYRAQAEYLALPASLVGTPTFVLRKVKREKLSFRAFDMLSPDLLNDLLVNLANEYINSPNANARRGWCMMRAVCVAFRDAANEAATTLMNRLHSRVRSVEDFDDLSHVCTLRSLVLPTGLNLWRVVDAYKHGSLAGYEDRVALLAYLRIRCLKPHDAELPPRQRHPTELVSVAYVHSHGQLTREFLERGLVYGTRSKAGLCPVVRMRMRVPQWRLRYLEMGGWREVDESCRAD